MRPPKLTTGPCSVPATKQRASRPQRPSPSRTPPVEDDSFVESCPEPKATMLSCHYFLFAFHKRARAGRGAEKRLPEVKKKSGVRVTVSPKIRTRAWRLATN